MLLFVWATPHVPYRCAASRMGLGSSLMLMPARVLLIGSDPSHLGARAAVLDHFWEIRTSAQDPSAAIQHGADLVVVLETIPEDARQSLVEQIKQQDASVLVVKLNGFDSGPFAGADAIVDAQHGPGALVSAVYELLTERGLGSRAWPIAGEAIRIS